MPEIITEKDAQYAYDIVKTICTQVGPGLPGTSQERERAGIIKEELESHLGAGNVVVEEFNLAPWAFLGSLPMSAFFLLTAVLLNVSTGRFTGVSPWLTAIAALVFSVISLLMFIFEYLFYFEFIDPFFKKKQSVNVAGTLRKPGTQNVKRLLILSGHHDSAWENTWIGLLGYGLYITVPTIFIGLITMLVMSIIQLTGMITGSAGMVRTGTLGWVMLVYPIVPSVVFAMFFNRGKKNGGTVPGAAAERASVPYKVKSQPAGAGGSDAGSFSQAGLKAATLLPFKVPQQLVAFYHQKRDSPEILTIEPLLNVLKLTLEWVSNCGE